MSAARPAVAAARPSRETVRAEAAEARRRDGDVCQLCRRLVRWDDRRSAAGGTYVQLRSGRLAVACRGCNLDAACGVQHPSADRSRHRHPRIYRLATAVRRWAS